MDHIVMIFMKERWKMVSGTFILVYIHFTFIFPSEPSSPPTNVSVVDVTSTSITITWDEVPAIDRNGIITEYEVEYNQSTFDINTTQTVIVNSSSTMVQLTALHEYVNYSIQVRAYTDVGFGPYSDDIYERTLEDG